MPLRLLNQTYHEVDPRTSQAAECFARGMLFRDQIHRADFALSDADTFINRFENGEGNESENEREADDSLLDAMGAMQEAQRAIGETTCISPMMKQPFITELRRAIDSIKQVGKEGESGRFSRVDVYAAMGIIERIKKIQVK